MAATFRELIITAAYNRGVKGSDNVNLIGGDKSRRSDFFQSAVLAVEAMTGNG